ncbi:MAG TPA: hypothetical protein VF407_01995 [Polyangiaceae bacterium]
MRAQRTISFAAAAFLLSFAYATTAAAQREAHETKGDQNNEAPEDKNKATADVSDESSEPAEKKEGDEVEPKYKLWVDAVFGWGDVPTVNNYPPTTLGTTPAHTKEETHTTSDSYLIGYSYRAGKLELGARLPIVHANFSPEGLENQRGATTVGNLELFAAYEAKINKRLSIIPELGIALPTAAGDELPTGEEVQADPNKAYDTNAYDRYSALQAASASRGLEESALFESKRLGIIPKIELEYKLKKLTIAPYIKLENMISTSSSNEKGYLGELVPGVQANYGLAKFLDVGLRAWASIAFDKEDHDNNALIVVEPQIRGHFGPIHPAIGLLLPVFPGSGPSGGYNPPTPYEPTFDTRFLAFRLAITAAF